MRRIAGCAMAALVAIGGGRAHIDCIDIEVPRVPDATAIARPLLRFFRKRELRQVKR